MNEVITEKKVASKEMTKNSTAPMIVERMQYVADSSIFCTLK